MEGSHAARHAAVQAGADAVYLGLESFNARRSADNFTIESLGEACTNAHQRGVSVYVTMNTVILPGEMDEALECVRQAYRAGADGFIVQDIGLAASCRARCPRHRCTCPPR
ncbi:U32 family peptidase, partial [Adlercreutzia equolifaciens]|uniref:peptidase U32 family protein n=1 Tax=Adlercreutzia equolifaciens TaxID=446660 RepID=UPI003D18F403|nr:U32 family peptidase [Adlercreutzia equolifaciens]